MKIFRLGSALIALSIFWGMLGGIAKIVTIETPDWTISIMCIVGAIATWFYIFGKESDK